jgi:hypothetical protein
MQSSFTEAAIDNIVLGHKFLSLETGRCIYLCYATQHTNAPMPKLNSTPLTPLPLPPPEAI